MLVIAGDAGGARALAPVIRVLRAETNVSVVARAYGAALEVWRGAGLCPETIESDDPTGYDRVLVGTSFVRERWELRVLHRARAAGIPTLAVVDFWSQYRERFTLPNGELVTPDRIAVVDEAMRREMLQAGFIDSADRLVVTGQPAFEALWEYRSAAQRLAARSALRAFSRPPFSRTLVLFVAQPLSLQYSADELGFHEQQVLDETIAALGAVLEVSARHATLLIKPHPRDRVDELRRSLPARHSPRLAIHLLDDAQPAANDVQRTANDSQRTASDVHRTASDVQPEASDVQRTASDVQPAASDVQRTASDVRRLALGSDLVVGMNSTALMEACLLRRPVLSYQPGLRIRDPLPSNRLGWSRGVYQPTALGQALHEELFDQRRRRARLARLRRIELPSGAAAQIASLVLEGPAEKPWRANEDPPGHLSNGARPHVGVTAGPGG